MKKCFFFLPVLGIALFGKAQKASFGLKAGPSFYSVNSAAFRDFSASVRTGFHGGAFYNEVLGSRFRFQFEVLYSLEGVELKMANRAITTTYSFLAYPFLLQWYASKGFFVETGPQMGFLLVAKSTDKQGGQTYTQNLNDLTRSYALSWDVGAGYFFRNVGLGVRYTAGLTRLNRLASDGKDKSNGLQISLLLRLLKLEQPFRGILHNR